MDSSCAAVLQLEIDTVDFLASYLRTLPGFSDHDAGLKATTPLWILTIYDTHSQHGLTFVAPSRAVSLLVSV